MTSSLLYAQAIQLNGVAVAHFESGDYAVARSLFRKALQTMKMASKEPGEPRPGVGFCWTKSTSRLTHCTNFVFQRALVIISSRKGSKSCASESMSIIYNIALSAHLEAIEKNSPSLRLKSMQCYKIALSIRQQKDDTRKLQGERLLDIGILNNLSQLYREECQFDDARLCLTEMSKWLSSLTHETRRGLQDVDCEGLMWNVRLANTLSLAPAA